MKTIAAGVLVCLFASCVLPLTFAAGPVDTTSIAPVEDLKAEASAKITALEGLVADPAKFAENKNKIAQAAGVLACLAQAIVEHKDREASKVAAADLRDAALAVRDSKSADQAAQSLAAGRSAFEGKSDGKASAEYEWKKLINMHRMMEEINARNAKIRTALRRPKDPQTESLHATTLAVLAVAMQADTHEVKDPAKVPEWEKFAEEFRTNMAGVAGAIKNKDKATAESLFKAAQKSCASCHGEFRKEE